MNKIEQVARAIYEAWAASGRTDVTWVELIRMKDEDGYANARGFYLLALAEARAAIEAMREPTEAMVTAGEDVGNSIDPLPCDDVWRAMIDAALQDDTA